MLANPDAVHSSLSLRVEKETSAYIHEVDYTRSSQLSKPVRDLSLDKSATHAELE